MREFIDIVENDLFEEATGDVDAFAYQGGAFGEQWVNEKVALLGGFRTGKLAPEGFMRLFYTILDMEEYQRTKDSDAATQGTCELYKDSNNQLCALIDIKLDKAKRKAGIGGLVIKSLLKTYGKDFTIIDIRRPAVGFWQKMGCEFYWPNHTPVEQPGKEAVKGKVLLGVIRQGSNTPLSELPAFFKKPAAAPSSPDR